MHHDLRQLPQFWADKTVLVAGGVGFIGRAIVEALLAVGAREVSIISRRTAPVPGNTTLIAARPARPRRDLFATLAGRRFDVVINVAGKIDQSTNRTIYRDSFDINFFTALNLIQALQDAQDRAFSPYRQQRRVWQCPLSAEQGDERDSQYRLWRRQARGDEHGVGQGGLRVVPGLRHSALFGLWQRPRLVFVFEPCDQQRPRSAASFRRRPASRRAISSASRRWFTTSSALPRLRSLCPARVYNSCTGVETRVKDVLLYLRECHAGFRPVFGAMPYRQGELMRSVGVPYAPMSALAAREELFAFLEARDDDA